MAGDLAAIDMRDLAHDESSPLQIEHTVNNVGNLAYAANGVQRVRVMPAAELMARLRDELAAVRRGPA